MSMGIVDQERAASVPAILVIEDHESVQAIYRRILGDDARFDLLVAGLGADALAVLQNQRSIALVLLDLHLPDMLGRDVLRVMRAWGGEYTDLPVAVVSSEAATVKFDSFLSAQTVAAVNKPFEPSELKALVDRYIGAAA